jgi:hypothetical protein
MLILFVATMFGAVIGWAGSWLHDRLNPTDWGRKFTLLSMACSLLDQAVVEIDETRRTNLATTARDLIARADAA